MSDLLSLTLALAFQGGFAIAVMILDRANRALPSDIAYVAVVEFGFALLFLGVSGLRVISRRRHIASAMVAPLAAELPEAGPGAEKTWRDLLLAARHEALTNLADLDRRAKDEMEVFLASVHALKTPITALSLMAQRARREGGSLSATDVSLEIDELERILDRVMGKLRLGDFESGSRIVLVDVAELVRASIRKHRRLFISRKVSVVLEGRGFQVSTDPAWLGFILDQLVSNAAKYTSTRLMFRLVSEGGRGTIELDDDGPGLDAEDLARAFGKSSSGSASVAYAAVEGGPASSGYGLYLAHQAALRLGMTLGFDSCGGTVARLSMPLAFDPRGAHASRRDLTSS